MPVSRAVEDSSVAEQSKRGRNSKASGGGIKKRPEQISQPIPEKRPYGTPQTKIAKSEIEVICVALSAG